MSQPPLILASRSPRRAMLLREAGYTFLQAEPPFDDPAHPEQLGRLPEQVAIAIAAAKAMSFRDSALLLEHPQAVVLAADTLIVHADGSLAGTPTTRQQAGSMIRQFFDARHAVVSAAAIWSRHQREPVAAADTAWVQVGRISDEELNVYLDSGQWQGKAGGYNLFDRQQAGWPITVEGDPATVVGLPMRMLVEQLRQHGITPMRSGSGNP